MEQVGYKKFITKNILSMPTGVPIYTDNLAKELAEQFHLDIRKAKGLVNVNMNRILKTIDLERFRKGIYYKTKVTPFGKSKLNPDLIVRNSYIYKDGETIGYESGATFMNQIGLTTQLAKNRYLVTNAYKRNGSKVDERLHLAIKKPITAINDFNVRYLQILDAIENKENVPIDATNREKILLGYIKNSKLEFEKLLAYASKYYGKETLLRLGEIAAREL